MPPLALAQPACARPGLPRLRSACRRRL